MGDSDGAVDTTQPTIGLLGASTSVRSALADRQLREGIAAIRASPVDVVVAIGESAIGQRLELDTPAPTLPVDVDMGLPSVAVPEVAEALNAVIDNRAEPVDRPVLGVSIDGGPVHRALFDVTVVSERPAHISEFEVSHGGETILETRADGIVVATPAGSHGYARAAGGVRVATDTEALVIVPISAFATADERWIVPIDALSVSVTREETPVQVRADDRVVETVTGGSTLEVRPTDALSTVVPSPSESGLEP